MSCNCNENQDTIVLNPGQYIICNDNESNWQNYHFGSMTSCINAGEWSTNILNGCPDTGWNYLCGYETGEHWDCLDCDYAYSGTGPWPNSPYYECECEDTDGGGGGAPKGWMKKDQLLNPNEGNVLSNGYEGPKKKINKCQKGFVMHRGVCKSRKDIFDTSGTRQDLPCCNLGPGKVHHYYVQGTPYNGENCMYRQTTVWECNGGAYELHQPPHRICGWEMLQFGILNDGHVSYNCHCPPSACGYEPPTGGSGANWEPGEDGWVAPPKGWGGQ